MILLYSKKGCYQCEVVKGLLEKQNIKFEYNIVNNLYSIAKEHKVLEDQLYDCKQFPIMIKDEKVYSYENILDTYDEPLLNKLNEQYSLYPIKYNDIYEHLKKSRKSFWNPEEITFLKDMKDWESLTDDEQYFISTILAFFATADGIVNENINVNFCNDVAPPEAKGVYDIQKAIETIHNETYSIMLDTYIKDKKKKCDLLNGIRTIPTINKKASWAIKWMKNTNSFAERLIAFGCMEGILFSGSFCSIFWLKKRGLLPGLCFANELISRDEGLHTDYAILLYKHINHKLSQDKIKSIVTEAVSIETEFITSALPCKLIGMNSDLMIHYIKYVADHLVVRLGYQKLYNVDNPFDWMESISLNGKTNFFEKRVGEYSLNHTAKVFSQDDDF